MSLRLHWVPSGTTSANIVSSTGRKLAAYHWGAERRHPFFHPIYSYGANQSLTCFAPWDHRWHKGLWWSWKYINDVLFWEDHAGDGGEVGESRVVAHEQREAADGCVVITERLEMRSVPRGTLLLSENRELRLYPSVPGIPGGWAIDWTLSSMAETDCLLHATPYPQIAWGGYAGLNFRPARAMGWGETIVNSGGQTGSAACHGQAAMWAAYAGNIDGNEHDSAEAPAQAGIAILDHPGNLRHPTDFYAWSMGADNRGFGFLAASPLMHAPLRLAKGTRLPLRYRVILFDGQPEPAALAEAWAEFAAS